MAGKPRLTTRQQEALLTDYKQDTDTSVEDLAARHGVSKQTLYATLKSHGITPGREHTEGEALSGLNERLVSAMAKSALRTLIDDLAEARQRISVLENELRKHDIDPYHIFGG